MPVLTTRLTKRVCESTKAPATGSLFLRDGELPGFALRIWPTRRTFILEKRIHGQVRRVTIGPFGPLTVEQARKRAHELIGQISQGHNPTATRKAQRDELTFGELETLYLARYAVHKKSKKNDVTNFNRHLADWRPRKLSALTRRDVATLHAKLGADGHPYGANRVVALVRVMFNLANDWGVFSGPNPAQRVKFFKEEKRDRFVLPTELPKLLAALKEEPNPYIRLSFVTDLLTGARKNEVLTMQWPDLDLDQAVWRIPDTKADRPHLIPLPLPLVVQLKALPRLHGNTYVFPGRHGRSHLKNVLVAWGRIRTKAGLGDVRIHDLRRTLGSWLAIDGASLPMIGKVLNHSQPSTTAIYARLHLDPVRVALESNAQKMLNVGGPLTAPTQEGHHEPGGLIER